MLGTLAFVANSILFYYLTSSGFLTKLMDIGIPGISLLCTGLWMACRSRASGSGESPSAPVRSPLLRQALPFVLCTVVLIAAAGAAIADKSTLLREGRKVLIPITPIDPRAFMFGDYMELDYSADGIFRSLAKGPGCLPLAVDTDGHASPDPEDFLPGRDCTSVPGPALSVEKTAMGDLWLRLPRRWYVEEGCAPFYDAAAFAILRFDKKNRLLLEGLADHDGHRMLPPHTGEKDHTDPAFLSH